MIGWALMQAARLHRVYLSQKLVDLDLFAGQEQVLQALTSPRAVTIGELATILRVRTPTASKMVTRLAAVGFVERCQSRKDARTVRVRLTRKGRMAATRLQGLWSEVERDLVQGLDSAEQRQLQESLLQVATNLSRALGSNEPDFDSVSATYDDQQAREHQSSSKTGVLVVP
jgi:DNA-binding MarR family transcriptional regulator